MLFQVGHTSTSEWRTVSCCFFSLLVLIQKLKWTWRPVRVHRRGGRSTRCSPFRSWSRINNPTSRTFCRSGIQESRIPGLATRLFPVSLFCTVASRSSAPSPARRQLAMCFPPRPCRRPRRPAPRAPRRSRILDLEQPLAVDYGAVYSVLQRVSERQRVQPDLWLP
jgi:hypothetical protein